MVRIGRILAVCFTCLAGLAASPPAALSETVQQVRLDDDSVGQTQEQLPEPKPEESLPEDGPPSEDLKLEDIPAIESVELTDDAAKRALDAFVLVRDKYNDQGLDDYETLEEFVSKTEAGKRLEGEVKGFGFENITQWNSTIMAVGFAYNVIEANQESAIRQQIEDVKQDKTLDEAARTRMLASLNALIPSEQNRKVLRNLLADPIYRDKLKLLEDEE